MQQIDLAAAQHLLSPSQAPSFGWNPLWLRALEPHTVIEFCKYILSTLTITNALFSEPLYSVTFFHTNLEYTDYRQHVIAIFFDSLKTFFRDYMLLNV